MISCSSSASCRCWFLHEDVPTLSRREQCKNVARPAATGLALHNIVPPRCAGRMYDRKKILCASVPWCVCASSPADARSKSAIGDALFWTAVITHANVFRTIQICIWVFFLTRFFAGPLRLRAGFALQSTAHTITARSHDIEILVFSADCRW